MVNNKKPLPSCSFSSVPAETPANRKTSQSRLVILLSHVRFLGVSITLALKHCDRNEFFFIKSVIDSPRTFLFKCLLRFEVHKTFTTLLHRYRQKFFLILHFNIDIIQAILTSPVFATYKHFTHLYPPQVLVKLSISSCKPSYCNYKCYHLSKIHICQVTFLFGSYYVRNTTVHCPHFFYYNMFSTHMRHLNWPN